VVLAEERDGRGNSTAFRRCRIWIEAVVICIRRRASATTISLNGDETCIFACLCARQMMPSVAVYTSTGEVRLQRANQIEMVAMCVHMALAYIQNMTKEGA
jgi:hypothetical protein